MVEKVLFASTVSTISPDQLSHVEQSFDAFCKQSKALQPPVYLVWESMASQETVDGLKAWAARTPNVRLFHDDVTSEELAGLCKIRTVTNKLCKYEMIARCRNKLMELIEDEDAYADVKHVIMSDMNIDKPWPVAAMVQALALDVDAMASYSARDLDLYSLRHERFPFGSEVLGEAYYRAVYQPRLLRYIQESPDTLIPVISAFNQLCIFKRRSILGCRYSVMPSLYLDRICRNRCDEFVIPTTTDFQGCILGMYMFPPENIIFYYNNAGCNFPIVNMHVIFFLEMLYKGAKQIYMNKDLAW